MSAPADAREVEIAPARAGDREAILAVMEHWNMHHVPSPEMPGLDLDRFCVALLGEAVVGAGGYALLGEGRAKTTLLGVVPAHAGTGVGAALQDARLLAMARHGVHTVLTNADRPATIAWYLRRYGYVRVGTLAKLHEFGLPGVHHWTTLELALDRWVRARTAASAA